MVMGSSQRNALNKTALGAANALTNWSTDLVAQMEKQGVGRYPKQTPNERRHFLSPKFTTDDKETVTFERWRIRQLLDQMDALKEKLLRFEKKPTVPREGK